MKKIFSKSFVGLFISALIFGQFFTTGFFISPRIAAAVPLPEANVDIDEAWSNMPDGTWIDDTTNVNNDFANDFDLGDLNPGHSLYIGMNSKFKQVIIDVSTVGSREGTTLWEYWNGGWKSLEEIPGFNDPTNNFINPVGIYTITFADILPSDWITTSVNGTDGLYWVKVRTTTGYRDFGYGSVAPKGTKISAVRLNTNASLSDLSVSVGSLNSVFASSTLNYTSDLTYGTSTTPDVFAISADPFAASVVITPAIDVTSEIDLDRTTTIVATAEDSVTTETYTILFNKPAPKISEEAAAPQVNGTSITMAWITDHPATSRVIYDTTSHPMIGLAPDYGYATSTIEDPALVINHSVLINGLTPSTIYYFRSVSKGSPEAVGGEFSATTGNIPVAPPVSNTYGGGFSNNSTAVATTTQTNENTENLLALTENEEQIIGEGVSPAGTINQEIPIETTTAEKIQVLTTNPLPTNQTLAQPTFLANILSAINSKTIKILGTSAGIIIVFFSAYYIFRKRSV